MKFNINTVIEDMVVVGETYVRASTCGREVNSLRVVCECRVCGRTKVFRPSGLNRIVGTSHRMCNHEETERIRSEYPKFYRCWACIKARINNPNSTHYARYGGRGLENDYEYFVDFCEDLFPSYLEHVRAFGLENTTVEREDNELGYLRGNVKWATWKEQAANRCTTVNWECTNNSTLAVVHTKSLMQFTQELGLRYSSVHSAMRRGQKMYKGWSFKKLND